MSLGRRNTIPELKAELPHYGYVNAALIYVDKSDPANPIIRNFDLKAYLDEHFDGLNKLFAQPEEKVFTLSQLKELLRAIEGKSYNYSFLTAMGDVNLVRVLDIRAEFAKLGITESDLKKGA